VLSVRVEAGTARRIKAALRADEDGVAAFVRMTIEGELERHEQAARRTVALRNVAGWIG